MGKQYKIHHGLPADTPVILTVCRLADQERYKGYDQIFEALPLMRRAVPQVHYLLVGTGPDRLRIEQRIRSLGLERHVTLVGYVDDAELCAYYNACDLFAMPSKAEGFGIVYLEALACDRPVLAGNRDGARDALIDGELGLLVDADDIEALAEEWSECCAVLIPIRTFSTRPICTAGSPNNLSSSVFTRPLKTT